MEAVFVDAKGGTSTEEQTQELLLENEEAETVFFKLKVTDPEAIKASPKEGSVKPKESMTVKTVDETKLNS
nr:hypothetical protein BaRGS_002373 [Batillaria attramentaria]